MKLNMDCMRELLIYLSNNLKIETGILQKKIFCGIDLRNLYEDQNLSCFSSDDIFYSAYNLMSCNFIEAKAGDQARPPVTYSIFNITYAGHQFLESIREPTAWERTKNIASAIGNHSLKFLEDTAQKVAVEMGKTLVINMCNKT